MLFNKKTTHVIRWIWIVMSIVISLSMVITYSGFTMLPATTSAVPSAAPIDTAQTTELGENPATLEVVDQSEVPEPAVPALDFSVPTN